METTNFSHSPTLEELEDLFVSQTPLVTAAINIPNEKETITIDLTIYDVTSLTYNTNNQMTIELKKKDSK